MGIQRRTADASRDVREPKVSRAGLFTITWDKAIRIEFSDEAAMPNINRPSRNHKTDFRTRDGDLWLPFTDETLDHDDDQRLHGDQQ